MARAPRHDEAGVAIIYAVVLMAIIAVVTSMLLLNARETERTSRSMSNEVLTWPHVQSAITGYRMALGARLATDADGYTLSEDDLRKLAPSEGTASDFVATGSQIPEEYRSVGGVWMRVSSTSLTRTTFAMPNAAFHQSATADADVCTQLGLSESACDSRLHGFWQVLRVELPDRTAIDASGNVVVYFRAWLQAVDGSMQPEGKVAAPTVVRTELRPGRFADFQLISDGPIEFGSGAEISGPVHSNGFDAKAATRGTSPVTPRPIISGGGGGGGPDPDLVAVNVDPGVTCSEQSSISSAQGSIEVPAGLSCANSENTNRYVSFLRVFDELDLLTEDAGITDAAPVVLAGHDVVGSPSRLHAWQVWLEGDHVRLLSPTGDARTIPAGAGTTGILIEDDILMHGGDLDGRLTIAARRLGSGSASIYIDGDVNANTTKPGRTLGLIAQGDIIIDQRGGTGSTPVTDCRVRTIRAALIAATGGLTIPPQYATDERQPAPPQCTEKLTIDGAIASHRAPNLQWTWGDGSWAGYRSRAYSWDTRLLSSPPPYFPLTGTWQAVSVRQANVDCYAGGRAADAKCR